MTLSISKLERLLAIKGFVVIRYFVMYGTCVYIEIIAMSSADSFLLYIPSKYKFNVGKDKQKIIHKIKYLDIDEEDIYENTADNYAGKPDEHDIENEYKEVDVNVSPTIKGDNIGHHLEENYMREIKLKDISLEDSKEAKEIVRQLKRLRFCVQSVRYKISILYSNFLFSIKRDNSIECYTIKNFPNKRCKKLYVSVDLELLYEKLDTLLVNIDSVRKGIYHILDKNQFTHTKTLQKLLDERNDIVKFSDNSYAKKVEYEKYLDESMSMLSITNTSEKAVLEEIYDINEKYKDPSMNRLHDDVDHSHQISILEKKLREVQKTKEDIVKMIFDIKIKREDTMLTVDKIMFDNSVMLDAVLRNMVKLGKISSFT